MERHLHLVPTGADVIDAGPAEVEGHLDSRAPDPNVVDLDRERKRRRGRYHPAADAAWLDEHFDDDPLDPVC